MAVGLAPAMRRYRVADTAGDERYTRPATVALCARLARVARFTLDVAACLAAHVAPEYFTRDVDGRRCSWWGDVWCNPPYSDVRPWVEKAWAEMSRRGPRTISMLLPDVRCHQMWWSELVEPYRDGRPSAERGVTLETHFLAGRHAFDRAGRGGRRLKPKHNRPPFGLVLLVWRRTR